MILSAYGTAETNAMLARTSFGVAEHSQHIRGRALDFRLESRLFDAPTKAQAVQRGGIGWYPHSGFIHIDTGPIRNWTLDERGLDNLLIFDGQQVRLDGTSQALLGGSWRPPTAVPQLIFQRKLARAMPCGGIWVRQEPSTPRAYRPRSWQRRILRHDGSSLNSIVHSPDSAPSNVRPSCSSARKGWLTRIRRKSPVCRLTTDAEQMRLDAVLAQQDAA